MNYLNTGAVIGENNKHGENGFSLSIVLSFSALACFVIGIYDALLVSSHQTELLFLPLIYFVFAIAFFVLCRKINKSYVLTNIIIIVLQFIRCVIIPVFGTSFGIYDAIIGTKSFDISVRILIFEEIIVWLCCIWFASRPNGDKESNNDTPISLKLRGSNKLYIVFVGGAAVLYALFGMKQNILSFILLDTTERVGDITDSNLVALRTIVTTAFAILSLIIFARLHDKYKASQKGKYAILSIVVAIVMLSIIEGERRSVQVYKLFAYSWLLICLFPEYRKKIIKWLGLSAFIIISLMTVYKSFHAFLYGSYIEAIQNSGQTIADNISLLDSYFYGLNMVNRSVVFSMSYNMPMTQFFTDIFRNIFGVHYLFNRFSTTTEIYNLFLYSGEQRTGHLIAAVSYGYIFFGAILAPSATLLNILISMKLERALRRLRSIEFVYVIALIYMRFCFGAFCSFPSLLNFSTQSLFVYSIVVFLSSLITTRANDMSSKKIKE